MTGRSDDELVVLGGPAFGGARAVVVGPDDLVLEAGAASSTMQREDFVEHDFAVVDLARVDVEEQRAGGSEDAVGFDHARAKESDVVVKAVGVEGRGGELGVYLFCAVAIAAKAGAVAVGVADGADAGALLRDAGVERRLDVYEFDAAIGERAQRGEVFAVEDADGPLASVRFSALGRLPGWGLDWLLGKGWLRRKSIMDSD